MHLHNRPWCTLTTTALLRTHSRGMLFGVPYSMYRLCFWSLCTWLLCSFLASQGCQLQAMHLLQSQNRLTLLSPLHGLLAERTPALIQQGKMKPCFCGKCFKHKLISYRMPKAVQFLTTVRCLHEELPIVKQLHPRWIVREINYDRP